MTETVFAMAGGRVDLDRRPVLRGIDLTICEGEVVAVLGPNGSGKSTLIRALLGLIPLTAGSTTLYGEAPGRFRHWHRIGYVPQRLTAGGGVPATVREIVASGRIARQRRLRPASTADRRAIEAALGAVGLRGRARDPVQTLSGGQQQRVLIARALAGEPDTYVMDEPTAGVDAHSQLALATTLRDLSENTVLLVAHELGPLEPLVTRVIVLDDGMVTYDGPPPAPIENGHVHPHADEEPSGWLTA